MGAASQGWEGGLAVGGTTHCRKRCELGLVQLARALLPHPPCGPLCGSRAEGCADLVTTSLHSSPRPVPVITTNGWWLFGPQTAGWASIVCDPAALALQSPFLPGLTMVSSHQCHFPNGPH